jgi:hypothetical protein
MDNAFGVSRIEGIGDFGAQLQHRSYFQGLAGDAVPESLAFQHFHGDECASVRFIDFVDGADVRMIQRGCGLGLALETAEGLGIVGEIVGKKLQGHVAAELEVFCFIDDTHPAATQLLHNAVVRDGLADHS